MAVFGLILRQVTYTNYHVWVVSLILLEWSLFFLFLFFFQPHFPFTKYLYVACFGVIMRPFEAQWRLNLTAFELKKSKIFCLLLFSNLSPTIVINKLSPSPTHTQLMG